LGEAFDKAFMAAGIEDPTDLKDRLHFDSEKGVEGLGLASVAFGGSLPHDPTTFEMPKERWVDPESDIGIDEDNHPINSFYVPGDHNFLAGPEHVGGPGNAVQGALAGTVPIVEEMLRVCVIDRDYGVAELAVPCQAV